MTFFKKKKECKNERKEKHCCISMCSTSLNRTVYIILFSIVIPLEDIEKKTESSLLLLFSAALHYHQVSFRHATSSNSIFLLFFFTPFFLLQ
jgi:hypothetical protein